MNSYIGQMNDNNKITKLFSIHLFRHLLTINLQCVYGNNNAIRILSLNRKMKQKPQPFVCLMFESLVSSRLLCIQIVCLYSLLPQYDVG